jgi:hypothetical protein
VEGIAIGVHRCFTQGYSNGDLAKWSLPAVNSVYLVHDEVSRVERAETREFALDRAEKSFG